MPGAAAKTRLRVDFHIHLAGDGTAGSGCILTPRMRRRLVTRYIRWAVRMPGQAAENSADLLFRRRILHLLDCSHEVDLGLLLALDRIHRDDGRPDNQHLELFVPNDYVLELARKHWCVLAGVSIHPYRPDAVEELSRCAEAGAAAVKWLPVSQNIDPGDRRCVPFYSRLAELGLPLLCHTGAEHAFRVLRKDLADPAILRPALDRGVTVVAAHCGLSVLPHERSFVDSFDRLVGLYPNLYGDVSSLCIPRLPGQLRKLWTEERVGSRLVQGSDWPIPIRAWWLPGRLSLVRALRLDRESNPLDRDVHIKRALGLPEEIFYRGAGLLPPKVLAAKQDRLDAADRDSAGPHRPARV